MYDTTYDSSLFVNLMNLIKQHERLPAAQNLYGVEKVLLYEEVHYAVLAAVRKLGSQTEQEAFLQSFGEVLPTLRKYDAQVDVLNRTCQVARELLAVLPQHGSRAEDGAYFDAFREVLTELYKFGSHARQDECLRSATETIKRQSDC